LFTSRVFAFRVLIIDHYRGLFFVLLLCLIRIDPKPNQFNLTVILFRFIIFFILALLVIIVDGLLVKSGVSHLEVINHVVCWKLLPELSVADSSISGQFALMLVVDPVAKGLFMARAGAMACFERRKLLEQQSKSFIY